MRLIDADKLIEELSTMYKQPTSTEDFMTVGYDKAIADVVVTTHRQPTAEQQRKKGKWVLIYKGEKGYSYGDFKCSVCDRVNCCYHLTEYCCHCGAEMERTRVKK